LFFQMAVVQHNIVAQLGTTKPKSANQVVINGPKSWRAQFSQFKIEPLLIRNAPSVEITTALAENSRLAARTAYLIYKQSLPRQPQTMKNITKKMAAVRSQLLPQLPQSVIKSSSTHEGEDPSVLEVFDSLHDIHHRGVTTQPHHKMIKEEPSSDQKSLSIQRTKLSISESTIIKNLCKESNKENKDSLLYNMSSNIMNIIKCDNDRIDENIDYSITNQQIGITMNTTDTTVDFEKHNYLISTENSNEYIYSHEKQNVTLPRPTSTNVNREKLKRRFETEEDEKPNKKVCPEVPKHLLGHLDMSLEELEQVRMEDALVDLDWVLPGGRWTPQKDPQSPCQPRHRVAVVVPFRDRYHHLAIFLRWLHPILRRQQLSYTIYVVEQ
ncbi:unnamed protein product, partial [Meganyctiphanes norvegica]